MKFEDIEHDAVYVNSKSGTMIVGKDLLYAVTHGKVHFNWNDWEKQDPKATGTEIMTNPHNDIRLMTKYQNRYTGDTLLGKDLIARDISLSKLGSDTIDWDAWEVAELVPPDAVEFSVPEWEEPHVFENHPDNTGLPVGFKMDELYVNVINNFRMSGKELLHLDTTLRCINWKNWVPTDFEQMPKVEYTDDHPEVTNIEPVVGDSIYVNIDTGAIRTSDDLNKLEPGNIDWSKWVPRDDVSKGRKFDTGKPDWSLVPADELGDIATVFTMGGSKYGRENWKAVENGMHRYYAAAMRHLKKYKKYMETGDTSLMYDDDAPHCHHLAHAATNLLFLMWLDNNNAHVFSEDDMPDWWKLRLAEMVVGDLEDS